MPKMYRVLAFWMLVFTLMGVAGGMMEMALLFAAQTVFFFAVSYLNLSERVYLYIFGAYLTLFFVGFTYWTAFMMVPGGSH